MRFGPIWQPITMAVKKATAPKAKSAGPLHWDQDDEKYPRKNTHCKVCGRYGEMKLAWDQRSYLCIHAGKCIARAHKGEEEALEV